VPFLSFLPNCKSYIFVKNIHKNAPWSAKSIIQVS
jgi:hypothetical protein